MNRGPGKWTVLAVLFVLLVLADQGTKFLAVERLTNVFQRHGQVTFLEKVQGFYTHRHLELQTTGGYTVWAPAWRMIYVENPGAAWSLFSGLSERVRNAFFTVISLAAVAFVLAYYRRLRRDQRYYQVALALLLAGAVGNFVDRLARGYVIDFIDWYVGRHHWPTFNVADSLIVVGVALLILHPGQRKAGAATARPASEREPARQRGA
jgi:signal peptidase II